MSPLLVARTVTVEVPASSANLGAGYDSLAIALDIVNRVELAVIDAAPGGAPGDRAPGDRAPGDRAPGGRPIDLAVEGEGAGEIVDDRENRFIRGLDAAFEAADPAGAALPAGAGWSIRMTNGIPLARGMGSSAAATVGGLVAGNALLGGPLGTPDLLRLATAIEGHPDNAAAALLGGIAVSTMDGEAVESIRLDIPAGLGCVLYIPELRLSTAEMRRVLPAAVPLADAVANVGRVGIGVAGLATGRLDVLRFLTIDRLHEPYRAGPFPALPALVEAARAAGALGACLSGAGSTVIAFAGPGADTSRIEAAFRSAAAAAGLPGRTAVVTPRRSGGAIVTSLA